MSIYPVPIKEWFFDEKSMFYKHSEYLKKKLPDLKCEVCGGEITIESGYVMHAFAYGYHEAWCSEKCLDGENVRERLNGLVDNIGMVINGEKEKVPE